MSVDVSHQEKPKMAFGINSCHCVSFVGKLPNNDGLLNCTSPHIIAKNAINCLILSANCYTIVAIAISLYDILSANCYTIAAISIPL